MISSTMERKLLVHFQLICFPWRHFHTMELEYSVFRSLCTCTKVLLEYLECEITHSSVEKSDDPVALFVVLYKGTVKRS